MKITKLTKRLIKLSFEYKGLFFLSILLSLISMGLAILTTDLSRQVLDSFISNSNFSNNKLLITYAIIFLIITPIFNEVIKRRVDFLYSTKTLILLRKKLLEKYLFLNKNSADLVKADNIVSRFSCDLGTISSFATGSFPGFISKIIRIIMITIYTLYISWKMGIVCIILLPLFSFISSKLTKPIEKLSTSQVEAKNAENSVVQNSLNGILTIKSYCLENYMSKKYEEVADIRNEHNIKLNVFSYFIMMVQNAVFNLPNIIIYLIGGILIFKGSLTYGVLVAVTLIMKEYSDVMNVLPEYLSAYYGAKAASEHIFSVFDKDKDLNGEVSNVSEYNTAIKFSNVHFGYNEDKEVLKGINLDIKKGEKVAIIGESGCGKTTLIKLVEGFYTNYSGDIEILGHSLREWNGIALREQIAYVSQNPTMFLGTIEENVKMSRNSDINEIKTALELGALSNSEILPEYISKGGTNISGGQKQRIALARCILKKSPIIVLDEPTSALDTINEEKILQTMLLNKNKDVTALVISHRFATLKYCDRIIVIKDGSVVQEGKYDELICVDGLCKRLFVEENGGIINEQLA